MTKDGKRTVSASDDKTLKVWDLESGQAVATFYGDADALCCAWIDKHKIVAGDALGRVHFLFLVE